MNQQALGTIEQVIVTDVCGIDQLALQCTAQQEQLLVTS